MTCDSKDTTIGRAEFYISYIKMEYIMARKPDLGVSDLVGPKQSLQGVQPQRLSRVFRSWDIETRGSIPSKQS